MFSQGEKFTNPDFELRGLREATEKVGRVSSPEDGQRPDYEPVKNVIDQYSALPHEEVLDTSFSVQEKEIKKFALNLSPETHDRQIEELITLVEEKGIKNTMRVVEKMGNPHLLDDFHRFLVQLVLSGYPISGLKEKSELWKPLHMNLFEVSLPDTKESDRNKKIEELISGMEQFYAGMLSITSDNKNSEWFSIEIANPNNSEEFIFFVAVPESKSNLLTKQVLSVFPGAKVKEPPDDYNIFNEDGVAVASSVKLSKHFLYPLKHYEHFGTDPLNSILNSFSKIDKEGEGAAIQVVVGSRRDYLMKESKRAIEKIRKGDKIKDALDDIDRSASSFLAKEALELIKGSKKPEESKPNPVDQESVDGFNRKLRSPLVSVNIRVVASAASEKEARAILQDIESSFNQFEDGHGNRIDWQRTKKKELKTLLERFSLRTFSKVEEVVLNLEELTSMIHFPSTTVHKVAPSLKQSKSGTAPVPIEALKEGLLIGHNEHQGESKPVFIGAEDRMRHFYTIGQTGTGKTTLLKNMIIQDIRNGNGVCFIDPHGSDVQDILASVPEERHGDVIYFDPASIERPMALNMLEYDLQHPEQKTFVVNEMFSIFQKLYGGVPESMGPMFEQYFRNATLLTIEDQGSGSTLLDVSRVMSNKEFRDKKISRCGNPIVVQFWKEVAEKAGGEAALANIVPYITSKFDVFLANDIMRPIVAQEKSSFNMREVMDGRKILLVNLSKGRLGDINSHLIGLIIVGKILMAALSRVDATEERPDFFLYLDEFQNITTDSIATILSEARKYRLSLTVAHQFVNQLDDKIKNAVFGNVGSMAVFRVGAEDAEFFEKQFEPTFTKSDITNLDNFNAYVKMLANGRPLKPFNMQLTPPAQGNISQVERLKNLSAETYGRPRAAVEAEIMAKYRDLN